MRNTSFVVAFALALASLGAGLFARRDSVEPERIAEPMIIELGDAATELTTAEEGVFFDIDAMGVPKKLGWTRQGSRDAFLAIDENHNGQIDNGAELVGGAFGPPDGFAFLAAYDGLTSLHAVNSSRRVMADQVIDARDAVFQELILWTDLNHNGISEENELQSLAFAGISNIDLRSSMLADRADSRGNRFRRHAVAQSGIHLRVVHTVRLARLGASQ